MFTNIRDWSLITGKGGGGGATQREGGGHLKFYPYKKVAWSFNHIEGGGGTKSFHSLKWGGGGATSFTLSWELGGCTKFRTRSFPIL